MSSILKDVTIRYWLRTSFKIAVLLTLPYGVYFWNFNIIDRLYYHSIAFYLMFSRYYNEWSIELVNPITLLLILIICIPAIYFDRYLSKLDENKSIRIQGILVVLIISFLGALFGHVLPNLVFPRVPDFLTGNLMRFTTLVLVVFVFLPVLSREVLLLGYDRVDVEKNASEEKSAVEIKHKLLGVLLALLVFVIPYVVLVDVQTVFRSNYHLVGSTVYFLVEHDIRNIYIAINFSLIDIYNLIFYLSLASLRVLYSYCILRYLRGLGNRYQSLIIGVLGVMFPLAALFILSPFYVLGPFSYLVPIPVIFFL
ncbi:MAG: hypothetical protein ACFFAX_10630, partial [Promethearchaeota archaeon]